MLILKVMQGKKIAGVNTKGSNLKCARLRHESMLVPTWYRDDGVERERKGSANG